MRWGILEQQGHKVYGGQIEETRVGGAECLRVVVPALVRESSIWDRELKVYRLQREHWAEWEVFVGGGSLYRLRYCGEKPAREAALDSSERSPDGPERVEVLPLDIEEAREVKQIEEDRVDSAFRAVVAEDDEDDGWEEGDEDDVPVHRGVTDEGERIPPKAGHLPPFDSAGLPSETSRSWERVGDDVVEQKRCRANFCEHFAPAGEPFCGAHEDLKTDPRWVAVLGAEQRLERIRARDPNRDPDLDLWRDVGEHLSERLFGSVVASRVENGLWCGIEGATEALPWHWVAILPPAFQVELRSSGFAPSRVAAKEAADRWHLEKGVVLPYDVKLPPTPEGSKLVGFGRALHEVELAAVLADLNREK